jgi:hypothetical protein
MVEYQGALEQVTKLATHFEEKAVVLLNPGDPSTHVSQPLMYLLGRETFVIQREQPNEEVLRELTQGWRAAGRPVYLVLTWGRFHWHPSDLAFKPLTTFTLQVPILQRTSEHPPEKMDSLVYHFDIYQVMDNTGSPAPVSVLEMGPGEYPYVQEGFYGLESIPEASTVRWTDGRGRVRIPWQDTACQHHQLRISAMGGRPAQPQLGPPEMNVWVNGVWAKRVSLPQGFSPAEVVVPLPDTVCQHALGYLEIELRSTTWVPLREGVNQDPRELGVLVDRIALEPTTNDQ